MGARDDVADAGVRLLAAYADDTRRYHGVGHLADVLTAVDALAGHADDPDAVRLAAWFHDAVYDPRAGDNEERSAAMAQQVLDRLRVPPATVTEVVRLVRLTRTHDPAAGDADGSVLCDADLAVLGRDGDGYAAYARAVRAEYAHVPDDAFRVGRAQVLRGLLARPTVYSTPTALARWEQQARANMSAELAALG